MIINLTSYSLVDFIPYTKEIYYSLIANSLTSHFPLHLLTVVLNLIWIWTLVKKKYAFQLSCLGLLWFICGYYFYGTLYAQLNWAASTMQWICYLQALIFMLMIPSSVTKKPDARALPPMVMMTSFIALGILPLWPVTQAMDWNALSFPGLNSSSLWLLSLGTLLTMPFSKFKFFALLPSFGLILFSLMRFYVFHLA